MAAYTGAAVASAAASVYRTRLPNIITTSSLPLFSRHSISLPSPSSQVSELRRLSPLPMRASSSEETSSSVKVEEIFVDLKEKWDGLENKSTVFIYGGGALVAVWLSSIIVGAINSVPLLPKIMELVGLGYLLFKSSRKELVSDIESLKKKFAGSGLLDQENS